MINIEEMKNSIFGNPLESGGASSQGVPSEMEETEVNNISPENIDEYILTCPVNEKGNHIVPDEVFDRYYRQLPNGTVNQSGSKYAVNGGILKPLGSNPEADKEIHRQGGLALQAKYKQRLSMAETLDALLRTPADSDTINDLRLAQGATKQDALLAAMYLSATEGNVKAGQFIRDTVGEQPTTKQDIAVQMTDEDRKLLEKVENRLNNDG